jgi:hypothetical protein
MQIPEDDGGITIGNAYPVDLVIYMARSAAI